MSDILGRYRLVNKDTLLIQVRALNIFTFLPYIGSTIWLWFVSLFQERYDCIPEWVWTDWTEYNNLLHEKDEMLNYHAKEMQRLVAERQAIESMIKGEIKTLEGDEYANRGYSKPFDFNPKKVGPIGLRFEKPEQTWKKVMNAKLWGGGRKKASDGKEPKWDNSGNTETSTYTLEDYNPYRVSLENAAYEQGSDRLITYKENKPQQKGKGKGNQGDGFNPKNRKKQEQFGETPEGHKARLAAIQAGDDVSEWNPW